MITLPPGFDYQLLVSELCVFGSMLAGVSMGFLVYHLIMFAIGLGSKE